MEEKVPEKEEQKAEGPATEPNVTPGQERTPGEHKGEEQAGEGTKEEAPKGEGTPEDLFDVIVPVGTPRSIIRDVVRKFPVQLVERKMPAYFANMEGDEREVLAFRGPRKVVEEVEQFIRKELEAFIETGGWDRPEKKREP